MLFKSKTIGDLKIDNRFVHSATYEAVSKETGEVSDELVKRYERLARGGVGLIITGHMFVSPEGRSKKYQTGIHTDDKIAGLKKLAATVHAENGKIIFQLNHAGQQTTREVIGRTPVGPSSKRRDPLYFVKPREMTEEDIQKTIKAFAAAADRARKVGADGVQFHAAHGFLINQFLSPFFNVRTDSWGGSDENQFRFLKEIILETRRVVSDSLPILVKLNTHDYTPKAGVTPSLAIKYAEWLIELGVAALEVSCGNGNYAFMQTCRGDVPVNELVKSVPWWQKPIGRLMVKRLVGKYDLEEAYNLEAARKIKPVLNGIPLILVGGMRTKAKMEAVLENNEADFISMSRPFIREPNLVNRIRAGKIDKVSCVSCNRCMAAMPNNIPIRCYHKGFPD
jgi:2,4-dienoyl-CoA reductase-like NADH-dependent reductase (Old Yellow Enzyme family)